MKYVWPLMLEPSCCKRWQKKSQARNWFVEWYQIGPKWAWVTTDPGLNHLLRISLVSFRTFRCPLFSKQFLGLALRYPLISFDFLFKSLLPYCASQISIKSLLLFNSAGLYLNFFWHNVYHKSLNYCFSITWMKNAGWSSICKGLKSPKTECFDPSPNTDLRRLVNASTRWG